MQKENQNEYKEVIDDHKATNITPAINHAKAEIARKLKCDLNDITWRPLFGKKLTENINNLGYIIGFTVDNIKGASEQKLKSARYFQLRVDYDKTKGAHVNYGNTDVNSTFIRCVCIEFNESMIVSRQDPEGAVYRAWNALTKMHFSNSENNSDLEKIHKKMQHNGVQNRTHFMFNKNTPKLLQEKNLNLTSSPN